MPTDKELFLERAKKLTEIFVQGKNDILNHSKVTTKNNKTKIILTSVLIQRLKNNFPELYKSCNGSFEKLFFDIGNDEYGKKSTGQCYSAFLKNAMLND